ncbi:hypothetical protein HY441_00775 [Candidatus Microgenomates bacterium]|nr:hypothetical protein [Candidatus Microgenomates bacterium]
MTSREPATGPNSDAVVVEARWDGYWRYASEIVELAAAYEVDIAQIEPNSEAAGVGLILLDTKQGIERLLGQGYSLFDAKAECARALACETLEFERIHGEQLKNRGVDLLTNLEERLARVKASPQVLKTATLQRRVDSRNLRAFDAGIIGSLLNLAYDSAKTLGQTAVRRLLDFAAAHMLRQR